MGSITRSEKLALVEMPVVVFVHVVPPSLDRLDVHLTNFELNSSQEVGIFVGGNLNVIVPEPGTLLLLAIGSVMLVRRRRHLRRRSNATISGIVVVSISFLLTEFTPDSSTA